MLPALLNVISAAPVALTLAALPQAGPESSPGVRNAHAAVYDSRDHALVLSGGATASEVRADLWRWRAGVWRLAPDTGPDRRTFPAMAYDSTHDQIVLFGGSRVLFGD